MVLTRKIQIYPVGDKEEVDRVYQYLRDGIYNQNKAMNQYMSALFASTMMEISQEDRKELNRLYSRIPTSKKGSAYSTKDITFPTGLPLASSLTQKVRQDFSTSVKNGLLYGKVSLPTYRKENPLLIHVDYVRLRSTNPHLDNGLYHNYASHQDFLDHLYDKDAEILIKFANGITFKLILGQPHKSAFLRSELQQIFEEHYKVCGSSIQFEGKKIILNLAMDIPKKEKELDKNRVVGVDLGIEIPAMCAVNFDEYHREKIGQKEDFLRVRTQLQSQAKSLYQNLKLATGGHGRKKKLKANDRFHKRERNFVKTYNHFISKRVVDFALKNNAKYINLEDLTGFKKDSNDFILRNWSYYELQSFIEYKAGKYGIIVRKVNPYHTSQICSKCGHWEEGQRLTQAKFKCKNCGYEDNADFNASRNIALSTDFTEKKKPKKKKKKEKVAENKQD